MASMGLAAAVVAAVAVIRVTTSFLGVEVEPAS